MIHVGSALCVQKIQMLENRAIKMLLLCHFKTYVFRVKDQYKANPEVILCLFNKIVHKVAMH